MLTGTLPFDSTGDSGDWHDVINAVLAGEYIIPQGVSQKAADLIFRILQPDPKQRIAIKHMWQHPLLKKYENLDSTDLNGRPYTGPAPPLTIQDCGAPIKRREDIDDVLLGNLGNLWHGVSVEELAEKLLCDL